MGGRFLGLVVTPCLVANVPMAGQTLQLPKPLPLNEGASVKLPIQLKNVDKEVSRWSRVGV